MVTPEEPSTRKQTEPWIQRWEELGQEQPQADVEPPPRSPTAEAPADRLGVERRRPLWRTALGHSLVVVALLATGAFIVVYLEWIQGEAAAPLRSLLIYFGIMTVALIAARVVLRRK